MDYTGRGSNKGKVAPKSNNRKPTISITVNVDLRRMAEALMFLLEKGYNDASSKSGLGRLCIEMVAAAARKQHGVPECETIEEAVQFLRENGITWTRHKDISRLGNLLTFESVEDSGMQGFEGGAYKHKTRFNISNNRKITPEDVLRHSPKKHEAPDRLDDDSFVDTPSDERMSSEELNARRKAKDDKIKSDLEESMRMMKEQGKGFVSSKKNTDPDEEK